MSIQMSLVFATLIGQMVVLLLLVLPLPHPIRAKIVDITWVLQKSQNFKVGVAFSIILLVLQFLDCVNRLKRISGYSDPFFVSSNDHRNPTQQLTYDQLATKFYSQRNLYLSGAVLYLMLAIGIVITIVRKLVKKESEYRSLLAGKKTKYESEDGEVEKYKQLISLKEQDIQAFKKQLRGLQTAYDTLSPEEQKSSKKSD
ncbi:ER 25 kDa transmembrane protein [Scheffersomyces stipitis CBS 6054]|uniref:Endoplasmic reticulum transmembrane protein n=1 Tax=Scheffersomyces stipitis (strain ATCC 58785 / CBS 6054 / NBRC 10063 / NRRL Y-11545) TaxID=322104 RepID=A3LSR2_PICST|nr:ER 25 kDa transmembrane protein [Scheffersomyces stipitis CBS 6054]ABN66277.2 ER 25 kDa transmembrane protein [Scheffersomyces stipitis CBS 6054]